MNRCTTLFVILGIIAGFTQCKKNKKDLPQKIDIVGYWEGKYAPDAKDPNAHYAFYFKADGTVRVYADKTDTVNNPNFKADGIYSLNGSTVRTTYTYAGIGTTYSTQSVIDASLNKQIGTFGSNSQVTGKGNFWVIRK